LPSTVDDVSPPEEEGGGEVAVLVVGGIAPPAGGVEDDLVLEELEHAARNTPHTMSAPQIRDLAEGLTSSSSRPLRRCSSLRLFRAMGSSGPGRGRMAD
jgi:hypothetical protein